AVKERSRKLIANGDVIETAMMNRFRALRASSVSEHDSTCSRPGTHPVQDIDGRKGASVLCVTSKSEKFILSCVRLCASPRIRHHRGMGTRGRYSIMLFRGRGEGTGIEVMIDSDDRLDVARAIYEREIIK